MTFWKHLALSLVSMLFGTIIGYYATSWQEELKATRQQRIDLSKERIAKIAEVQEAVDRYASLILRSDIRQQPIARLHDETVKTRQVLELNRFWLGAELFDKDNWLLDRIAEFYLSSPRSDKRLEELIAQVEQSRLDVEAAVAVIR